MFGNAAGSNHSAPQSSRRGCVRARPCCGRGSYGENAADPAAIVYEKELFDGTERHTGQCWGEAMFDDFRGRGGDDAHPQALRRPSKDAINMKELVRSCPSRLDLRR
jgi:hypothetical protein